LTNRYQTIMELSIKLIYFCVSHIVMNTNGRTTIVVARKTREKLKSLGREGETYNDIIARLINEMNREEIVKRQYERLKEKDKFVPLESI
jgi:predicted CopG family antitoxin